MCYGQATRGERAMKGLPGPPKESCDSPGGCSWHGKSLLAEEENLQHNTAGLQGGDLALSPGGDGRLEPDDSRIPRSGCRFL